MSAERSGGLIGEAALALYGTFGRLAGPALGLLLAKRARRGKEDPARRGERFGHAGRERPPGRLVWVHAASVGETIAVLPLLERLAERDISILITTGTVTAAQIAERRLPPRAIHQFVPLDTPGAVGRFLGHWRPGLAIFVESELWPTTLKMVTRKKIPIAVVNARMSENSFRSWQRMPPVARSVLGRVSLWLAQFPIDAERLGTLGARNTVVAGNLKFDVPPPDADESAVAGFREQIGTRPVFVAASTHPGEEPAVIAAHKEIARNEPLLLTIIAPRHPQRGDEIAAEIAAAGMHLSRRSAGEAVRAETDVLLADTIGEMGLWYRLADVAFLGGSMVARIGGQNPIEPAKLGVPVLHGRHVGNFRDVYAALSEAGAVREVNDAAALSGAVGRLIADKAERERRSHAASACIARFTGSLDRTLDALAPYLDALPDDTAARS